MPRVTTHEETADSYPQTVSTHKVEKSMPELSWPSDVQLNVELHDGSTMQSMCSR